MLQNSHRQILQCRIIRLDDMPTTLQHPLITLQLSQANASHDVGHVALVPRANHVVFPGAQLGLGQCVLVLSVQGVQLRKTIQESIPGLALNGRHS